MTDINWTHRLRTAIARAGSPPDDDVIEELAQHAEALYKAARADGDAHEQALQRVDLQIAVWAGDAVLLKRRGARAPALVAPSTPATTAGRWGVGLLHDLRYAARLARRRAAFTLLVVATMAIGIGTATTLFSVAYGVLFAPLPWQDAERLVIVKETRGGREPRFNQLSNASYLAWREAPETIEGLAAWSNRTVTMSGHGEAERVNIAAASAELFPVLGARALIGRLLDAGDERRRQGDVIVLSEGLWRQRFGGDPASLGRAVQIDGVSHTIVGVLPDRQAYPDRLTRAWIPQAVPPAAPTSMSMLNGLAKLRPGTSPQRAAAEGTARARTVPPPLEMLMVALFGGTGEVEIAVVPVRDARSGMRPALLTFLAAVSLLFITATANVVSLLLTQATTRTREMALRAALGAGSMRVVRQLLVESVFLAALGGATGLALSALLHGLLPSILPAEFARLYAFGPNLPVLAFALVLSGVAGIAVGLLPAARARRVNLVESLSQGGLGAAGVPRGSHTARVRWLIMAGQVAIACVLLVGATLLVRSVRALMEADRGYTPARLVTAWIPLPTPAFEPVRRAEFVGGVLERLQGVRGIEAVAFTDAAPLGTGIASAFTLDGRTVQAELRTVSAGYFRAMGMPVRDGRAFTDQEAPAGARVLVVSRAFARQYIQGPAAGRRVRAGLFPGDAHAEIVGVVDDVQQDPQGTARQPQVYLLERAQPRSLKWSGVTILVRTAGDPVALIPTLRSVVREQNAAAAIDSIMTMEERLQVRLQGPRLAAVLLSGFAGFALLVAAVGLFGVLSYTVAQRSRELAVRSALGARPVDILALVLRQGLSIAAAGAALGLPVAFALARATGSNLYGVAPGDPAVYVSVAVTLTAVALCACALPAWRAARVDPLRSLKAE